MLSTPHRTGADGDEEADDLLERVSAGLPKRHHWARVLTRRRVRNRREVVDILLFEDELTVRVMGMVPGVAS